jgi:hypothetical protein
MLREVFLIVTQSSPSPYTGVKCEQTTRSSFIHSPHCLQALNKTGCTLGTSQLRVLPSKTAIVPVNKELMPRSHEELERCSRCAC